MITVAGLALVQGAFHLSGVSFTVPGGAYGVLMGPTGCGKTSILEALCGLRALAAGRVAIAGVDVSTAKPGDRGIGYVPQDGALFTTMTVREHLAFALRLRRWPEPAIRARVDELAGQLGITALLDRRPHGLSGGERQRVALGRALSFRPAVLCLDEPLAALDEDTQDGMHELLAASARTHAVTVLHITHSRHEARRLAQVLFTLRDGVIAQQPLAVLDAPRPGARVTAP